MFTNDENANIWKMSNSQEFFERPCRSTNQCDHGEETTLERQSRDLRLRIGQEKHTTDEVEGHARLGSDECTL